jgi:hypothetical protein
MWVIAKAVIRGSYYMLVLEKTKIDDLLEEIRKTRIDDIQNEKN